MYQRPTGKSKSNCRIRVQLWHQGPSVTSGSNCDIRVQLWHQSPTVVSKINFDIRVKPVYQKLNCDISFQLWHQSPTGVSKLNCDIKVKSVYQSPDTTKLEEFVHYCVFSSPCHNNLAQRYYTTMETSPRLCVRLSVITPVNAHTHTHAHAHTHTHTLYRILTLLRSLNFLMSLSLARSFNFKCFIGCWQGIYFNCRV